MNAACTIDSETQDYELELVQRIGSGDQRACEELLRRFGGRMLAVARRLLYNEEDATDAVQDAFLSAFQSLHRFERRSGLGTWLHRILINACLMKRRNGANKLSIESLLPTFDASGHHVNRPQPWSDQVQMAAERTELRQRVRQCIERLPEPYRQVLLLRDIEELDTAETARLLVCSVNNVKVRLHRARQALRTLLTQHCNDYCVS
jgi:RNA polymerase sigma-70 factor, ECF subfamily